MKTYHNMLRIYISHPFSGNEKENRRRANNIAWALTMKYPNTLFINPLDAMRHAEYAALSYEQILEQCKCLLCACDAVYMAGAYQYSQGCTEERKTAITERIPVLTNGDELKHFIESHH